MTENRKHPRKAIQAPVAIQIGEGARIDAICNDISLGGMFIETSETARYGAKIKVFMMLPGMKQEAVIEATVRWAKPGGMGVQFAMMGARETHAITELMKK